MSTYQESRAPKVTVAIPTYRGAAHLGAAIDSVLNQTLGDFELVVLDDNSPDDTAAIVARFPDPRLVYLRNSRNLGPLGNWDRCLSEGRGEYFKLLPHDDVLQANCLERQVAVLDADLDKRVALVFSSRDILAPDGKRLTRRGYPGHPTGLIPAAEVMRSCIRRGTNLIGEPGAVLFRKSLADKVGRFDATYPYVIDLDYWFRLLRHGDAYCCPEPLAGFRVSGTSWSVAIGAAQSADFRGFANSVASSATSVDRLIGRFTGALNNLARLVFYRIYLP
jgi:glycosyltransferase involved in cell wall biosynthesis